MVTRSHYPDSKVGDSLESGWQFQDFVCATLAREHIILQNLCSKKYQYEIGENLQGFEIKFDSWCSKSQRLSIEVAEKTRIDQSDWIPSGIYRYDNSWLYIQGNYNVLFILMKTILIAYDQAGRYPHKEEPTVRAFYLPFSHAERIGHRIDISP